MVVALLAAMTSTSSALAGTFSRPVLLPEKAGEEAPWHFAVNDRGQAVAVTPAAGGARVYAIGASGRVGRSWLVRLPGGYGPSEESVALDDRGRIAVAISYSDGSVVAHEEHENGCCMHVAIATWHLGTPPP